ncbi:hypothetical protein ACFY8Q_07210 [[Kitasatospora] papulosa]|uniref:hypothetical protein n=1 Tax=[Kitasatospora] papulosa TaxID=1464011 RepID=UPI0036A52E22
MPRRTMAQRRRRAAEREQRRDVLLVLLSRHDRNVITDAERPLLRAHVEAELRDADDLRRTVDGHQRRAERLARQLDAAHDAIREAEQLAADYLAQLDMYRTVREQQRPDRAARIRAFLAAQTAHLATPETDLAEGAPGICQYACTHPTYLHNETGCRAIGCPCRATDHPTASPPEAPGAPEVCCDCGSPKVAYHNYREQPFCWPCADGQPAPTTLTPEQP